MRRRPTRRGHWIYERPFGDRVRAGLVQGAVAHREPGGGVTCVSQTGGPETVLAGEARLPFALIGFVTDHANGVMEELTPAETLARLFGASAGVFQTALRAALPLIAADPGEPAGIVFSL